MLDVVARLRGEGGCPWDREQSLESLKQYLVEESYEVIDAIDSDDPERHKEELGDVLLQVVLHAQIRDEQGEFTFHDVAEKLADKLVRRHPHVFGDVDARDSKTVLRNWETMKTKEKTTGRRSVVEGVPRHLPALQKAERIQTRVSRVGFDWSELDEVAAKVEEEFAETKMAMRERDSERIREEIGDLLFAVVNLSRFQAINAEEALRSAIDKFTKRFQEIERRFLAQGRELSDCTLDEMNECWESVKKEAVETCGRAKTRCRAS